jgi:hypothetical protein
MITTQTNQFNITVTGSTIYVEPGYIQLNIGDTNNVDLLGGQIDYFPGGSISFATMALNSSNTPPGPAIWNATEQYLNSLLLIKSAHKISAGYVPSLAVSNCTTMTSSAYPCTYTSPQNSEYYPGVPKDPNLGYMRPLALFTFYTADFGANISLISYSKVF